RRCCLPTCPDEAANARTRQSLVPYSLFPIPAPASSFPLLLLPQSTYSELTDSPNAIRRIVSASSSATPSWRILPQPRAASDSGMVSVTTSSSSWEPLMLSIAAPESTGCVQYAATLVAPCALSAAAAAHRVPAVSTMSSTSTQVLPSTSPMMFITVATLAL